MSANLRLLLRPRDELIRREVLRRLSRGTVDLTHDDVLPPMYLDAELDQPAWFYAGRGGGGRGRLCMVSCHLGGQVGPQRPPDHPMSNSRRPSRPQGQGSAADYGNPYISTINSRSRVAFSAERTAIFLVSRRVLIVRI